MQVTRTEEFARWLDRVRDAAGKARIEKRLQRVELTGYFGLTRSVGEGVFEIKMDFDPGYRVYYAMSGPTVVYLLAGGDKDSQHDDIRRAVAMRKTLEAREWTSS